MKSITTLILLILISCKCSTNKINKDIGEEKITQLFMDTNIVGIDSSFWSSATDSIIEFNHAPDTPYNPKQILYDSCKGQGDVGDIKFPKPFQVTITSTGILSLSEQYDTIKILMLVCDTSKIEGIMNSTAIFHDLATTWQYGYEVRDHYSGETTSIPTGRLYDLNGYPMSEYPHNYYGWRKYLDADKKPLQNSIIVWQSIEVK